MVTGFALRVAGLALPALASAHPLHTSVVELIDQPATHTVAVTVRVFAEDLSAAVPAADPTRLEAYVRARFALADAAGRPIALRWGGTEQAGDVVSIRLEASAPGGLAGVRVHATLLCDRFDDQVNVVRAAYGGHRASLLFTRGDPAKTLP